MRAVSSHRLVVGTGRERTWKAWFKSLSAGLSKSFASEVQASRSWVTSLFLALLGSMTISLASLIEAIRCGIITAMGMASNHGLKRVHE